MVEADIIDGKIGEVGSYDVEFKGGKLVAKVGALVSVAGVQADLVVSLDAAVVLDAIAKAIPGTIDDTLLGILKAALVGK